MRWTNRLVRNASRLPALACLCACTPPRTPAPAPPIERGVPVDAAIEAPPVDAAAVAAVPIDAIPPVDAAPPADAAPRICSTTYNRIRDANVLVGMTEAQLRCSVGEPRRIAGATWHYTLPRFCSDTEDNVTVVFANGRVARASVTHRHTGKICEADF